MRKLLSILLFTAMLLTLAACGGDKSSGEKYTLTVWYWGEQECPGYKAYMEEIVQRYQKKYPNVTVDAVLQESDTLYSAFRTAESAGEGPDVQFLWGGTLDLEDAWLGNLVPVSDYITSEQMADIASSSLAETNWDGKQWGIPAYQIAFGVAYNKKMFADAGLDPENPYETWDEFIACCEALKKAGHTPLGFGLKDGWLPGWFAFYLAQQNLDSVNDLITCIRGDAKYTDPKYSEWLEKVKELVDKGYVNNDIQSLDFYQGQQLLENEQAAMTFHAHPYAVQLEKTMGSDTIGFARPPVYGKGKLATAIAAPCQIYTIPKSAKHKEGAAQFILFLHEEDNLKLLYEKANALMPNMKFKSEWLTSEVDKKVTSWLKEYKNMCYQYYYPPMFEYEGLVPVVQKMFSENLSPADAAKELDAVFDKWREQNPEQLDAFKKWSVPE
ncbi:MAG TPA: carbohydrate ABC transporter substrate-binding protein [Clostridiaceae bacterium]|nr:carbohydrate ABC transporter substrate-binding protein [Clostridiaceae bacterium]